MPYENDFPADSEQGTFSRFDPVYSPPTNSYGHHRRQSSGRPLLGSFDGSSDHDQSRSRPSRPMLVIDNYDDVSATPRNDTSVFRRLTNRLSSPTAVTGPLSSRHAYTKQYATIQESDVDAVPIDLSSLTGLGFQLHETSHFSPATLSQSTNYQNDAAAYAPNINHSHHRRDFGQLSMLGAGMRDVRTEIIRDPSSLAPSIDANLSPAESIRRSKTVRGFAQDLADQRNVIVAVNEPIDVTLFESNLALKRSQTFDEIAAKGSGAGGPTTYIFPSDKDADVPNWRPFSMRAPYVLMLLSLALGLAGVQEYLCQLSLQKQDLDPREGMLSFMNVAEVSTWEFFVWKYLPTMITIAYSVLFSIMDFDIRRLEPYYQLSQPQGSPASASLNLDHLTMFQYFIPFNAFKLRQFAVLVSTVANIIAATVAPALQNPSVNFVQNTRCGDVSLGDLKCENGETQFWVLINPIWSRFFTGSYLVVALATMFLFFQLRRKSGLMSDPRGIAGIAAMATKSHILQDFQGLDLKTRGGIHDKLAHRRYVLYKSSIWQGEWNPSREPQLDSESRLESPHPVMLRLHAGLPFIGVLVFCLAAVPVISLTDGRIIPNTVPWLPILIATIVKLVWSTFEADVRMMEPFYQLSKGNARPENSLTLDYQSSPYGWMPVQALINRHFLVACVGIATIGLDIFSVTVSSFSVNSAVFLRVKGHNDVTNTEISNQDETYISFWTSEILSLFILTYTIAVASTVYARRRHPFLPREPSTIAAVLAFIYSSNMLDDFIGTEKLSYKAMETKLKGLGKRYGLGWYRGRDNKIHCAIDEGAWQSAYTHGKPYTDAVMQRPDDGFYAV